MITVLQRQNISRRAVPPVAVRERATGVRWSSRELGVQKVSRERPSPGMHAQPGADSEFGISAWSSEGRSRQRSAVRSTARSVLRFFPWRVDPTGLRPPHRFLQKQMVRAKRRREKRSGERRWARVIQRAAAPRRDTRAPSSLREEIRGSREAPSSRSVTLGRLLRRPWPYVVLACMVVLAVALLLLGTGAGAAIGALSPVGLPLGAPPRPELPEPPDADPALYALAVPDMPGPSAADLAAVPDAPTTIATLKIASYRTVGGDTLSRIASRFRVNVDTIVSWNGIHDGRSLQPGTILNIPNADGLRYVVRRGDTLQGIARSSGVDFNGILDWNRLDRSVISVGQQLFLPGARMSTTELNRVLGNLFLYPVVGRISSYFGERSDPFTGVPNFHNGIDIVNRPGTPIRAAMDGTVADVGFNYNYGNYVILKHAGGYQTLYGHMIRYLVSRGEKVKQGDTIGELGTTGYSTGPHVHFSIFRNGVAVDPLRFLK
ncbi:MAG TPA: M23 family metallopeptidase [Spirochaetia bacterium]|nr:M23 family metallopeptidase [Spirochaetia bacterium]